MFKSQLQEYAQKAGLPAPVYDIKREGPSHEPQFKASVVVQGEVYESPSFFNNLKKAEHAAAEVALAAISKSNTNAAYTGSLHESGLCKNLLQEYAQKCKLPLPVYSTVKSDETSPVFIATVEIAGVPYKGGSCKSKKEAEIKAARTALVAIYADSGASFLQAIKNHGPDNTPSGSAEPTSAQPKQGVKRKKKLGGGNKASKAKLDESAIEETKETAANGNTPREADNNQGDQINGSSSLLASNAEIPGITLPVIKGSEQTSSTGNPSISSTSPHGIEQSAQSPHAQQQ